MSIAIHRLKKQEIVWLATHNCKHGHSYLSHPNCYEAENPLKGRIGFFDIETSNLDANYGVMIDYCIKDMNGKIISDEITEKDIKNYDTEFVDKRIVESCIKNLKKFDRIITYYGKRFDFPFIRTRALMNNLEFPEYGELIHEDIYFNIRYKFKLNRNRLQTACKALLGTSDKTFVDFKHWIRALQATPKGKKSRSYILNHCENDVKDLEKLYIKVKNFTPAQNTSI